MKRGELSSWAVTLAHEHACAHRVSHLFGAWDPRSRPFRRFALRHATTSGLATR